MASDPAFRLRRAKSAPSVQRRRQTPLVAEPLDPEIAKRHATAAASHAMAQARERSSNGSRGSGDLPMAEKLSHFAAPQRRRPPSIRFTDEDRPVSQMTIASTCISAPHIMNNSFEDDPSIDLSSIREFQGHGNEDHSAPSSYRRLRKARSMFSTRHRGSTIRSRPTGMNSAGSQMRDLHPDNQSHRSLRHSMSFFHSNNESSHSLRRIKSQTAAAQLARSQFFEGQGLERQRERHPSLLSQKHRQEPKPFRKTVRTTRELSPADDAYPGGSKSSNSTGLHSKARAVSLSIKKRLKRVFGHSGSTDSPSEPSSLVSSSNLGDFANSSRIENDEDQRPALRPMASSDSISTSISRVTSWTDSTAANTITARRVIGNRLSSIQEHGDSDGYQNAGSVDCDERTVIGKPIDPQRVYSALMKRISQTAANNGERIISTGTVKGCLPVPERASSVCSQATNSIRPMPSDISMKTARTSFTVNGRPQSAQSRASLHSVLVDENNSHTSQQIWHDECLSTRPSKPSLRESESTFFPSTSYNKPKTPSPYRLTMNSIRESDHSQDDSESSMLSKAALTGSSNSPSVYSRTPSGHAPSQENLPFDLDAFEPLQPGMATIFTSPEKLYTAPRMASPKMIRARVSDTRVRPSIEWKSWMNSQINKIDDSGSFRLPRTSLIRQHCREGAQIDGEPQQATSMDNTSRSVDGEDKYGSLRQVRKTISVQTISDRPPLTELRFSAQSNFSRPLSRQSSTAFMVPPRASPSNNSLHQVYQEGDSVGGAPYSFQAHGLSSPGLAGSPDCSSYAKSNESAECQNSPTPRRNLRATREARLQRSPVARGSIRHIVDGNDAKSVQFRSIRAQPDHTAFLNENTRNPAISYHSESSEMHRQLQGINSTIDSKRMVDIFLRSRRHQREESGDGETGTIFL